jgi:hypothetical protein
MNTILNLPKGNNNQSVEIEFTFDGQRLLETKTKGDEHQLILESLFKLMVLYDFIPKDKKGKCTLTDGEVNDDGEPTLDVYYYYDNEQDEETPILIMNDIFIDEIKSEVKYKIVEDTVEELLSPINEYVNSKEFEEGLFETFHEVGLKINIKPPKIINGITITRFDVFGCECESEIINHVIVN